MANSHDDEGTRTSLRNRVKNGTDREHREAEFRDEQPTKKRPYAGDWDKYKVEAKESSGVTFYPHPRYWLVGGKWYDLEPFLHRHPGGPRILLEARNRFNDCTFAFEAHHHNYKKARAVLARYEVKGDLANRLTREREAAVLGELCSQLKKASSSHRQTTLRRHTDTRAHSLQVSTHKTSLRRKRWRLQSLLLLPSLNTTGASSTVATT